MPLYAGKYAICTFLQNMRNMLRLHDRYKPVSQIYHIIICCLTLSVSEIFIYCLLTDCVRFLVALSASSTASMQCSSAEHRLLIG